MWRPGSDALPICSNCVNTNGTAGLRSCRAGDDVNAQAILSAFGCKQDARLAATVASCVAVCATVTDAATPGAPAMLHQQYTLTSQFQSIRSKANSCSPQCALRHPALATHVSFALDSRRVGAWANPAKHGNITLQATDDWRLRLRHFRCARPAGDLLC
jgi:hypothetical protein